MDIREPCKLLVVDDDQTILHLFPTALGREGYQVSTAASGREGLRVATESRVDVVLLDIHLPDISGIEVMRQIVKTTKTIVILVTGDDANFSHESAIQEGAADFILKPIRLPELILRIKQAREVRSLMDAKTRLIADLERLAVRDELTGLFNYRHFQGRLKGEVQRAQRYQRPLSLTVLDADDFKAINDTWGHAEGDRALTGIARLLTEKTRMTDTCFRYGGEEFVVLLPETQRDQALAVAERVRQAIEQAELTRNRRVTVSAGVAEFRPAEDAETLLRRADSALYEAKRAGRNRVAVA
jgi:two-component system cell cycle response regulator